MKIYLVSNNSLMEGLNYTSSDNLELIRMVRPLSILGEENAIKISDMKFTQEVEKIYSSFHSSALSTAKRVSHKLNLDIIMNEKLNDCKVGILGSKNMKMVKGLQDHDFTYKLPNGESLNDVGMRLNNEIRKIVSLKENALVFTHKRAILGYLLKYTQVGYNLDEDLILEYNNKQVFDDSDHEYDIYELTFENDNLVNINIL